MSTRFPAGATRMLQVSGCGDGGLLLQPTGPLSADEIPSLARVFESALDVGGSEIGIELADVSLVSAEAVRFFFRAAALCADCGVRFALYNADGLNLEVLELLGAAHLVDNSRQAPVSLGGG